MHKFGLFLLMVWIIAIGACGNSKGKSEAVIKMAEEKQKNLRGEPLATAVSATPATQKERHRITWPGLNRRQTNQPVYVSCTPEQCG